MQLLKQSTASTVVVGPVLDADGAAVTTAVAANFSIAKNGTVAALTSETVNHSANGYYTIELTTSNTNTLGRLDIIVNNTAMSMANHRYDVLVAATYDAIVTTGIATGAQTLDIQSRLPASLDSGNMRSSVQSMAANTLTASALAADAVTELQSGLSTLDASGVRTSLGMAAADMDTQLDAILAASGGSGVVVGPLVQTDSQRNTPAYIECNQYDQSTLGPFRVETASGGQFNFATQTDWIVVVWDKDDNQLGVVAYGDIDFTSSTNNAVMDQYSFAPSAGQVATAGRHTFAIRRPQGTTEQAPVGGVFNVIRCPRGPAV